MGSAVGSLAWSGGAAGTSDLGSCSTMSPPARVCTACKTSKVKCANFLPGGTCDRCARIGLKCEPAPQIGHRAAQQQLSVAQLGSAPFGGDPTPDVVPDRTTPLASQIACAGPSALSASGAPQGFGSIASAHPHIKSIDQGHEHLFLAVGSDETVEQALSQMPGMSSKTLQGVLAMLLEPGADKSSVAYFLHLCCTVALRWDLSELMELMVRMCRHLLLPMREVLLFNEMDFAPLPSLESSETDALWHFRAMLQQSNGLVLVRVMASGETRFHVNAAFERVLLGREEIESAWQVLAEGERDLSSLFTHPQDTDACSRMIASIYRSCKPGVLHKSLASHPIRLFNRVAGAYHYFAGEASVTIEMGGRLQIWSVEYTLLGPHGTPAAIKAASKMGIGFRLSTTATLASDDTTMAPAVAEDAIDLSSAGPRSCTTAADCLSMDPSLSQDEASPVVATTLAIPMNSTTSTALADHPVVSAIACDWQVGSMDERLRDKDCSAVSANSPSIHGHKRKRVKQTTTGGGKGPGGSRTSSGAEALGAHNASMVTYHAPGTARSSSVLAECIPTAISSSLHLIPSGHTGHVGGLAHACQMQALYNVPGASALSSRFMASHPAQMRPGTGHSSTSIAAMNVEIMSGSMPMAVPEAPGATTVCQGVAQQGSLGPYALLDEPPALNLTPDSSQSHRSFDRCTGLPGLPQSTLLGPLQSPRDSSELHPRGCQLLPMSSSLTTTHTTALGTRPHSDALADPAAGLWWDIDSELPLNELAASLHMNHVMPSVGRSPPAEASFGVGFVPAAVGAGPGVNGGKRFGPGLP